MYTEKYENDVSKLTGVDTNSTPALKTQYLTNPIGKNILPDGYPQFGSNRLTSDYKDKAYGEGKNENPYHNDYKKKFDSRYPSIWRGFQTRYKKKVRGLDDWEKAALYAALGKQWTPSGGKRVTRKFRKK